MQVTKAQKLQLKKLAHHLNPIVLIGNQGLSENVLAEIDHALLAHELIKIKVNAGDKQARQQMAETICEDLKACFIHSIGHVLILFRQSEKKQAAGKSLLS